MGSSTWQLLLFFCYAFTPDRLPDTMEAQQTQCASLSHITLNNILQVALSSHREKVPGLSLLSS